MSVIKITIAKLPDTVATLPFVDKQKIRRRHEILEDSGQPFDRR